MILFDGIEKDMYQTLFGIVKINYIAHEGKYVATIVSKSAVSFPSRHYDWCFSGNLKFSTIQDCLDLLNRLEMNVYEKDLKPLIACLGEVK